MHGLRAETWRQRLARFRGSNLTVTEFCRRERVSQPSFYQWRKRFELEQPERGRPEGTPMSSSGEFGPFVAVNVANAAMAEVEFPNGVRVRIPTANVDALRAAIRVGNELCLEAPSC
jgi:hypothetical protein